MFTITNLISHLWNLFFISSYGINMNVIHLLVLFEHWCHEHYLDTNVICSFILFRHRCYVPICVVYTWKKLCLSNAWHFCLNNMNLWNNKFHMDLKQTYGTCKFVMTITWLFECWSNQHAILWQRSPIKWCMEKKVIFLKWGQYLIQFGKETCRCKPNHGNSHCI
jgi:hypothetical protein